MIMAPCFLKNTLISTAHGKIRVNEIEVGDLVLSSKNKFVPVKFIGKRTLTKTAPKWEIEVEPIIVKQGAFGNGTPTRDLKVSPEHAFYIDELFYKAEELVNGDTIFRMGETPENEIEYYHVDLGFHALVFAEGAATESFGGASREHFDNCEEFYKLYGRDTTPYEPFAPSAYSYKRNAARLGNTVGGKLPKLIHDLGAPLARKVYDSAEKIEKRFAKRTNGSSRNG